LRFWLHHTGPPGTMIEMAGWPEFERARPDLAAAGRELLYQFGVGLAFLGTVDASGAPRVHPVCPILSEPGLFVLLIVSPKRTHLRRDGRFALHSYPREDDEDAFYIAGTARPEDDLEIERQVRVAFLAERPRMDVRDFDTQEVFALDLERCLLTRTTGHGDPDPRHTVWRSSDP
jgi:hypothetical protein